MQREREASASIAIRRMQQVSGGREERRKTGRHVEKLPSASRIADPCLTSDRSRLEPPNPRFPNQRIPPLLGVCDGETISFVPIV